MPFKAPWRNPETGDLAYGVNENPRKHPSALDRSTFIKMNARKREPVTISTIDEMRVLNRDKRKEGHQDEEALREALAAHEKYQSALDAAGSNQDIRRKCKGGLYWATMIAQKHVHFILDGIDMEAVVKKATQGDNPDSDGDEALGIEKNRTITGSELRWIYRNRDLEPVQQHVQFWFNGKQCPPPWETYSTIEFGARLIDAPTVTEHDGRELWSQYKPKVKHVSQDEVTQQNLDPAEMTKSNKLCCCVVQ